jgi:inhibitor of KinA
MMQRSSSDAVRFSPLGDQTIVVHFENVISIQVSRRVQSYAQAIKKLALPGVNQIILTFNTVAVCYDPLKISYEKIVDKLSFVEESVLNSVVPEGKKVCVPVAFGGIHGPDLEELSALTGFEPKEVISKLYSKTYYVYMVGFAAGTPYCGDIDAALARPRRSSPRIKVKKGTVAIANNQTNIYTIDSPGGWHLMGWTPMEIFNPYREQPGLLLAGDYIQYMPITAEEAERWDEQSQRAWDQEWNTLS